MATTRSIIICFSCLLFLVNTMGCLSAFRPSDVDEEIRQAPPSLSDPPAGRVNVYFLRHANFAGNGRTHILKIDGRPIGRLTPDNYFLLEMWPGEYHFSVSLPREEFFGVVNLPITVSRQVEIKRHPSGNIYFCEYTDGQGSNGFAVNRLTTAPKRLDGRKLAKKTSIRDTAKVIQFFDARYDGPATNGQPHGEGTLIWPDGSIYKGTFRHGVPTREAKFIFPDGLIFMGPNYRGRPTSPGILMNSGGTIRFAGGFIDEKPHGVGMRHGNEGPEFCEFEHGRDITKSFRQLAKEALDVEDDLVIGSKPEAEKIIATRIIDQKKRLAELTARHDPDTVRTAFSQSRKQIESLEKNKKLFAEKIITEHQEMVRLLRESRYERELAKAKLFRISHDAKIEKERQWCLDEFIQGNNLCTCAPLAENFDTWRECYEPMRKRYID